LLDAMRSASTEGMQYFDGEIEKMIRAGVIDFETGIAYSTNAGNLRLELSDVPATAEDPLLEPSPGG
jgi:Tfp pilus assembly ATPase PilU